MVVSSRENLNFYCDFFLVNELKYLVILLFITYSVYSLNADNIPDIKITYSKNPVTVNEPFRIKLEVTGQKSSSLGRIPRHDSLILELVGTGSNYVFSNSGSSITKTFSFNAILKDQGKFEIEPFEVIVNKDKYYSENIFIDSEKKDYATEKRLSKEIEDKPYYLDILVSDRDIYVNQYLDLSVRLYARNPLKINRYNGIKIDSLAWIEDVKNKSSDYIGNKRINDKIYEEYSIEEKRVFFSEPGEYIIPQVEIGLYALQNRGFFSYYDKPEFLTTDMVKITVRKLPDKPNGFSNAVGSFSLRSSLSDESIEVNDSFSLKIFLEGEGNFHQINDLSYSIIPKLDYFSKDDSTKSSNNKYKEKFWEYIYIPKRAGTYTITLKPFTYFDIDKNRYITLPAKSYKINVTGTSENSKLSITHYNNDQKSSVEVDMKSDEVEKSFRYIYTGRTGFFNSFIYRYGLLQTIVMYLFLIIFFLLVMINNILKNRGIIIFKFNNFQIFNNRINLLKSKNITNIEKLNQVYTAMEDYIRETLKIESIEYISSNINSNLQNLLSDDLFKEFTDITKKLDMVKYGGMSLNDSDVNDIIGKTIEICKYIENNRRKNS